MTRDHFINNISPAFKRSPTGAELVKEFRCSDRNYWRTQLLKMLAERREAQRRQLAALFFESETALARADAQPQQRR